MIRSTRRGRSARVGACANAGKATSAVNTVVRYTLAGGGSPGSSSPIPGHPLGLGLLIILGSGSGAKPRPCDGRGHPDPGHPDPRRPSRSSIREPEGRVRNTGTKCICEVPGGLPLSITRDLAAKAWDVYLHALSMGLAFSRRRRRRRREAAEARRGRRPSRRNFFRDLQNDLKNSFRSCA